MSDEVKCPNCGESLDHVMQSHYDYRDNRYSCSAPTSDPEAAAKITIRDSVWHRFAKVATPTWQALCQLEREEISKGKALEIIREEVELLERENWRNYPANESELARLRAEVQALREDKAMLDKANAERWQLSFNPRHNGYVVQRYDQVCGNIGVGSTLRDAIRAAMNGDKQ